jgi:hypothetical protein
VQAADLWEGNNVTCRGRLYRPRLRAILAEREMCTASVVVVEVRRQHTAQVTLIEDEDVIEAFAADRADDAFDIGVLPRRSRRGDDLLDGRRLDMVAEDRPI